MRITELELQLILNRESAQLSSSWRFMNAGSKGGLPNSSRHRVKGRGHPGQVEVHHRTTRDKQPDKNIVDPNLER
ncbi:hypothetical protein ATANTOWER_011892 [Ataeniobius toweri]|uniref:Uncharacterized protein n=1 Tax=Ataeniobius toweri TaxID=208326 RepID=A0ABU7AR05_9TELE|nr:hypothetical protein [Ataeniobius toweri]